MEENEDLLYNNSIGGRDTEEEEPDEEGTSVYEHHRLTADSGQKPMRIDKFLTEHLAGTSRNRLQRAAEQDFILVNGRPAKSSYKVKPGDEIVILLDRPKYDNDIVPEDITPGMRELYRHIGERHRLAPAGRPRL